MRRGYWKDEYLAHFSEPADRRPPWHAPPPQAATAAPPAATEAQGWAGRVRSDGVVGPRVNAPAGRGRSRDEEGLMAIGLGPVCSS